MNRKAGPPVQVKVVDESKGEVQAVFSTLKVIDKDGDVTLPGAFGEQKVRISAYNHQSWSDELPVGKGVITEQGDVAILDGQFFMDVTKARDTFFTIKNLDDLMEWSYGYDVEDGAPGKWPEGEKDGQDVNLLKKLKVHEVSPVILGAGVDTRTLAAKNSKGAIPYSETGTTGVNWDAGLMMRRCMASQTNLRAMCAWVDPSGDASAKSAYKFPHHMVSDSGAVGAANTRACSAVIAVLNGGRGGASIPSSDRQAVYNHVAHHISDAGDTPPPLKSNIQLELEMKLVDHIAVVSYDLDEVVTRIASVVTQRAEDGKQLGDAAKDAAELLLASEERLREVLTTEPRKNPNQEQLVEQIFRDSKALLLLTTNGEDQ